MRATRSCAGKRIAARHKDQAESFISRQGNGRESSPSLVGQQVGPYKIHSLLGLGGTEGAELLYRLISDSA